MSQNECLQHKNKTTSEQQMRWVDFITTYNSSHWQLRKIFENNWHILLNDPYLNSILLEKKENHF